MKNTMDKFGLLVAIAVTAGAVGIVATGLAQTNQGSISSQGEKIIERTSAEITTTPKEIKQELKETAEKISNIPEKIPESIPKAIDKAKDLIPEVPKVVKEELSDSKKILLITVSKDTSVPGCEQTNSCFVPTIAKAKRGAEIIWDNVDIAAHTVTSGSPQNGPSGLFDSGLISPGDTYSITLGLKGEYDYFCMVHPWMTGKITVA